MRFNCLQDFKEPCLAGTELNHVNKLTEIGVSSDISITHNFPL